MTPTHKWRPVLLGLALLGTPACAQQPLPLVASYSFDTANGTTPDSGPLKLDLKTQNAKLVEGKRGQALFFDGPQSFAQNGAEWMHKLRSDFSLTFWAKIERFPAPRPTYLVQKGGNAGWQIGLSERRAGYIHGYWGGGWYNTNFGGSMPQNTWTHVAMTMKKGDKMRLFFDGKEIATDNAPFAFTREGAPLQIGGGNFAGAFDELKIFAAPLSPEQILADMRGETLPTRAATEADFPTPGYGVRMWLSRFDQNIGFQSYDGRQKQPAKKVDGPDATDWPTLSMTDGRALFDKSSQTNVEVRLLSEREAMPPIRQPYDNEIQPVNHWFRANRWRWGRTFVYTTDRTARTSSGDYEIWTFPIQIAQENAAPDARPIQKVTLKLGGKTIYERAENLRSLTLLLPANLNGTPYELSVNGSVPAQFNVGLKPLVPNSPHDEPLPVDAAIPGTNLRAKLALSSQNANLKEWAADLGAMAKWQAPVGIAAPVAGMKRFINAGVPRAPFGVFTSSMQAGMSGGHRFGSSHTVRFGSTPQDYAAHLENLGYDFVYDTANPRNLDDNREWFEFAREAQARGVGFGLNPTIPGNLDILANPNLAFLSTYLPEWGRPAYRDAQLLGQRFGKYPNFGGLLIGADNAGYVTFWDWAPTIPDRPWARAFEAHQKSRNKPLTVPVGPALRPGKVFEKRGTQREFLDYIASYDKTFGRYSYFADAVKEVNPKLHLTTGSYGSSPGVGGRGGWPWASIPLSMNAPLPVLTAYDWNEQPSSKPMHISALVDRLKSEFPNRPIQALKDDFGLHLTRTSRQREYALALSRGVNALGTTFLPHPRQRADKLHTQDDQREMAAWMHSMSGAYANLKPSANVGILYVHEQAISRHLEGAGNLSEEKLLVGSHEGKTTEALFAAHAAGLQARIVTTGELKRGLDPQIKAILLVGLNRFDNTWLWSDGMENDLKKWAQSGGVFVRDEETVLPNGVTALAPGLNVRSFVVQSSQDQTQMLLDRNAENIQKLRVALKNITPTIAHSSDEKTWAIAGKSGDVDYVTVVNLATQPAGAGAVSRGEDVYVAGTRVTHDIDPATYLIPAPRTAQIEWLSTTGVIYDTRTRKKLTPAQAQNVDFTKDAFQFLAVSPREVSAPRIAFEPGKNGFWSATVSVGTPVLRGVPVQLDITKGGETVSVFGASETPIALPLPLSEAANAQIVARENLSGLQTRAAFNRAAQTLDAAPARNTVSEFWARKSVPLIVTLAPGQSAELGAKIQAFAKKSGREARVLPLDQVVTGLQPTRAIQRFPQWQTLDADVILLGSPTENVLVFDQARGELLDESKPVQVTFSPFIGERWALNLRDESALETR